MSKICKFCGAKTDDNAVFCTECGMRFEEQAQPIQQEQPVQYAQPAQRPYQPQPNYYQSAQAQPQYGENMYYQQQQPVQYASQPAPRQKKPGRGFGIASMILGIFAIVNGFVLLILNFSAVFIDAENNPYEVSLSTGMSLVITIFAAFVAFLALLSLIFGIVSLIKGNKGTAIAGLVMSVLSVAVCVHSFIVVSNLEKASWSDLVNNNSTYSSSALESDLESSLKEFKDIIENNK